MRKIYPLAAALLLLPLAGCGKPGDEANRTEASEPFAGNHIAANEMSADAAPGANGTAPETAMNAADNENGSLPDLNRGAEDLSANKQR